MEAFVNPVLEIFVSSDLAPSVENGVKVAKTPVGNHLAVGVLPPKCQNAKP